MEVCGRRSDQHGRGELLEEVGAVRVVGVKVDGWERNADGCRGDRARAGGCKGKVT